MQLHTSELRGRRDLAAGQIDTAIHDAYAQGARGESSAAGRQLWQAISNARPDLPNVCRSNRAIGLHVFAEVGACHGDADLKPRLPDVEATYYFIRAGITDEHVCAYVRRRQDVGGGVCYVGKRYGNLLHVSNTS